MLLTTIGLFVNRVHYYYSSGGLVHWWHRRILNLVQIDMNLLIPPASRDLYTA